LRILPATIKYPTIEENWPSFFEETNLMHLCQKYKPTKLRLRDEEAEKQQRRAEFEKDVLEDSD
jgi:DNA replication protein DnaC